LNFHQLLPPLFSSNDEGNIPDDLPSEYPLRWKERRIVRQRFWQFQISGGGY
jgi:hypothetical protein